MDFYQPSKPTNINLYFGIYQVKTPLQAGTLGMFSTGPGTVSFSGPYYSTENSTGPAILSTGPTKIPLALGSGQAANVAACLWIELNMASLE